MGEGQRAEGEQQSFLPLKITLSPFALGLDRIEI
jgi:hypothetical protein